MNEKCEGCANEGSIYCVICEDKDFYMTEEQKTWNDYMCDIMCGGE